MQNKISIGLVLLFNILITLNAQSQTIKPTNAIERLKSFEFRKTINEASKFKNIKVTNIGPTLMSGRAVDVCVNPKNENEFYVAYASGGLWHTINNGQTFEPLFDNEASITIGDIEVDWNNGQKLWVGTGENNSSRSSYAGTGIYCSIDSGKTWQNKGLIESHHIGKIIVNPKNSKTLWVAVLGHLYSYNSDRGIYKTIDGGNTWNKILFINDSTGFIDLEIDPLDENILYGCSWQRDRKPWNFLEAGNTSAIYKSVDGGNNWIKTSDEKNGFISGKNVGRIGISICTSNPSVVYAIVDNQGNQIIDSKEKDKLTTYKLRRMSNTDFLALDSTIIQTFIDNNNFLKTETVTFLKDEVRNKKISLNQIADYVSDANTDLFETPVIGAEVYKSTNAGENWVKTNTSYLDGCYNSYGYYFGKIKVSPFDENEIYVMGVPLLKSNDGGITYKQIDTDNMHGDHHFIWTSYTKKGHIINCNDGGLNLSYDGGLNWSKLNSPPVAQLYTINVDDKKPYNVYCGLQDNGVWVGSNECNPVNTEWEQEGKNCFSRLMGGDGMQIQIDKRDNAVFCGYQFGNYYRILKGSDTKYLHPKSKIGEKSLRFCWQTPILISSHCPEIFFMGSNKFHRSFDRGNNFETNHFELTLGSRIGDVPYGTITCIAESPKIFGEIYIGTDDGKVWRSKDIGNTFTDISFGLPKGLRVMRITPSAHDENLIYIALSGFQFDNIEPYLFKSINKGASWVNLSKNKLPLECINVVKEDLINKNIIYVGTDNGLYISFNNGNTYDGLNNVMPRVAVHDLVIQPNSNDLLIGTHGRSIYKCSLNEISKLSDSVLNCNLFVFKANKIIYNEEWGKKYSPWEVLNNPTFELNIYSKNRQTVVMQIYKDSVLIKEKKVDLMMGLNYEKIDIKLAKYEKAILSMDKKQLGGFENNYLNIGMYNCKIITNNKLIEIPLEIIENK
jgi:photosystem II stability/assembly factor-like uncharacterized protein